MCKECLGTADTSAFESTGVWNTIKSIPKRIAILLIVFYRTSISPLTPPTCRFYPTCSEYALTSFKRFGFLRGMKLTVKRIGKCHPFHEGGYDPVPDEYPTKSRRAPIH